MQPYEQEIRLITMNEEAILIEIPKDVNLYEIDMDSTKFDLGFFFDIEIISQEKPLFIGPVGNNHKSINILILYAKSILQSILMSYLYIFYKLME